MLPSAIELSNPKLHPSRVAAVEASPGRTAGPPLDVLPIIVWSPSVQGVELPLTAPEDMGRDRFGTEGGEDSLLANTKLTARAVSSILQDSDLKKVDVVSVEEALALSLQEAVTVCSYASIFWCLVVLNY